MNPDGRRPAGPPSRLPSSGLVAGEHTVVIDAEASLHLQYQRTTNNYSTHAQPPHQYAPASVYRPGPQQGYQYQQPGPPQLYHDQEAGHHPHDHHLHHKHAHLFADRSASVLSVAEAKERIVLGIQKKRARRQRPLLRLIQNLRSFLLIAATDGVATGIKVKREVEESAAEMTEKQENAKSIWKVMKANSPSAADLKRAIALHNDEFKRVRGYDMIYERGAEGETILHYAMLRRQTEIVNYLLDEFEDIEEMVNLVYEGPLYFGEHAAHIAVVIYGDDTTMLRRLISRGADVHNARASGSFFHVDSSNYMGETVLAFAACMGHTKIIRYLIDEIKIDPNIMDQYGNNVLHVLAWWGFYSDYRPGRSTTPLTGGTVSGEELGAIGDPDAAVSPGEPLDPAKDDSPKVSGIYEMLAVKTTIRSQNEFQKLTEPEKEDYKSNLRRKADDTLANCDGLTPFIVAVKRKQAKMVAALLDFKAIEEWTYGPVSQRRYNLSELDTFVEKETMNHSTGALEIAVKNLDIDIITQPIFLRLLEAKWKLYGSMIFITRFVMNLIYMILLTTDIALLPNNGDFLTQPDQFSTNRAERLQYYFLNNSLTADNRGAYAASLIRLVVEILIIVANLWGIAREFKEMSTSVYQYFAGFGAMDNFFQWTNILLFVLVIVFRVTCFNQLENTALGLASIFGWVSLLYYSKGSQSLGPLGVIFLEIIRGDLIRFISLVSVFVLGFSNALYLQVAPYADTQAQPVNGTMPSTGFGDWTWYPGGLTWVVRYIYGQGSYGTVVVYEYAPTKLVVSQIALLTLTILMVNVFIAMLNLTFSRIYGESEKNWRLIWAQLIMEMDERILAVYKKNKRLRRNEGSKSGPVTRIGVPMKATLVKPYKRLQENESKEDDLQGGGLKQKFDGPKADATEWDGYIYHFILEFRAGEMKPIRMIATFDPESPLIEDNYKVSTTGLVKNRRE
ncbi:Transient receptor putative cation channel sub V member 5 [Irineochytrium annulatum]|nr:Transient receptor putative cation channel sub V member 5 [Irineochytrium annulatum]